MKKKSKDKMCPTCGQTTSNELDDCYECCTRAEAKELLKALPELCKPTITNNVVLRRHKPPITVVISEEQLEKMANAIQWYALNDFEEYDDKPEYFEGQAKALCKAVGIEVK